MTIIYLKKKNIKQLVGKTRNFPEYFKLYEELFKVPPAHSISVKTPNIFYGS